MDDNTELNSPVSFFTDDRQRRLDLVLHLIPNSRQPILLRGPEASGKSFFLNIFRDQASDEWFVCVLETDELMVSPVDAIEQAANVEFGTEKPIQQRLAAWSEQGKVIVAIVEDAHFLDVNCLNKLYALAENTPCLRLIISSSDNLNGDIESRSQLIDLEPFTQKQTLDYAKFRINKGNLDFVNVAGIDDVVLFIETGGLPGRINDVLEQMRLNPANTEPVQSKNNSWFVMSAFLAAALVAIALTAGFWSDETSVDQQVLDVPKENQTIVEEKNVLDVEIKPPIQQQSKEPEALINNEKKAAKPFEQSMEEKALIKPDAEHSPQVPLKRHSSESRTVKETINSELAESKKVLKVIEPNKVEKEHADEDVSSHNKHHKWLLAQKASHFTLQLMGVSKEASAVQFITSKSDVKELRYFRHKRQAGAWYTIIYGLYTDRESAEKASRNLPKQLGSVKPWVRSVESVRSDMFK